MPLSIGRAAASPVVLACASAFCLCWGPPALAAPRDAPRLLWPMTPRPVVTRPFAPGQRDWDPGHRGVDLAGHHGQQVRAAGAGTVVFAGPLAGRPVVSVRHAGGRRTTYEPVDPAVRAGEVVQAGDLIGRLRAGHAGCTAAACLHWGLVIAADRYADPLRLLRRRVVLLPPR